MESVHASAESLGELLRHAREARGLTLDSIASETRIQRRYLEALEHDDLGATPGGFYQRAEIRAYARAVGLDQEQALARLEAGLKTETPPITPPPPSVQLEPGRGRAYVPLVLGVAVVAAALFGRFTSRDTSALEQVDTPTAQSRSNSTTSASAIAAVADARLPEPPSSAAVVTVASQPADQAGLANIQESATSESATGVDPSVTAIGLVVTTQPAGAQVTVNGIGWGPSPVTISYLPPGDKRIRVSKDGFVAEERVFRVSDGQRQELDIRLTAAP
jgi:cytoskeletal protein RodZ